MRKVLILAGLILMIMSCTSNKNSSKVQYAGEINGKLIDRSVFTTNFLFNYRELTKGNTNYQANDKEIKRLEDLTWEGLTRSVVIGQFIEKNNLEVTQEEVNDTLLTNPPKVLTESGYFYSNDTFDFNKYKKSILTNEPVNTDFIKSTYYQGITLQKIQQRLVKDAEISRSDVEKYYQQNYATADIILLSMDLDTNKPTVTNTEITYIWEKDKNQYFYEPSLSIKYIIREIKPTTNEISQTKNVIDSLYFSLSKGGDFDSAVREFSSNLNSYPLGKLPFLKNENVPDIIQNYVRNSQVGDVISPVKKNDVWYIYKVLEKTKSMVKLQELKHPVQISKETILQRREEFMQISDMISQIGIDNAGIEYGWEVRSADGLNQHKTFVEDLGDLSEMINDAYNKPDDYIYPPIYNKNERFLVMVQIVENRLNKKKDLELVFEDIKEQIKSEKQFDMVSDKLRSLADIYQELNPENLTDVTYSTLKNVSLSSTITNDDKDQINKDILSLEKKGDYTKCYKDERKGYLAILLKKNRADKKYLSNNFYEIQGEYRKNELDNYFNIWIDEQVDKAKVRKWFTMKDLYNRN